MCTVLQYLQKEKLTKPAMRNVSWTYIKPIDALHFKPYFFLQASNPVRQNGLELGSALELSCQTTATQLTFEKCMRKTPENTKVHHIAEALRWV